jgi:translation initiation factor IF-2
MGNPLQDMQDQIRELAYMMWEAAGRQQGMALEYWVAAERALLATLQAAADRMLPPLPPSADAAQATPPEATPPEAAPPEAAAVPAPEAAAAPSPAATSTAAKAPVPAASSPAPAATSAAPAAAAGSAAKAKPTARRPAGRGKAKP